MQIFETGKNMYAIGIPGTRAKYVVRSSGRPGHGGSVTGVRGVRPILDARFKSVKVAKAIADFLTERA